MRESPPDPSPHPCLFKDGSTLKHNSPSRRSATS
eukprot:CAMPEP_0173389704 /NCGR_PEP_ID=MMETSP1356-20130122/13140_1 /TAXON_ID=77927 ORGANISM="Hemiselmis virescens, Strain PCC157" /NCGR_SAMPLE_ID=MMETSP1356 /ASSEMBLY_ACC=CAM_ASM_000847 /LENGTH=33 /DNA_ID= /DNA_START= /DNA_END= /DNA_ORIENTATION=